MRFRAENIAGLKTLTEDVDGIWPRSCTVVEERSCQRRSRTEKFDGASGSENVGMSNEIQAKNLNTVCPRFPKQR